MTRDVRLGEHLWLEWTGDDYNQISGELKISYFTLEHVSLDEEVVRRALASVLQRDGVCDSLSEGFSLIDGKNIAQGWCGLVDEDTDYTVCDEYGETLYGEKVNETFSTTWVEI
jgi:hypothetical protein